MNRKPRCYVASPLGFTEAGRYWYRRALLPLLARYVELVDPWSLVSPPELDAARKSGRLREFWLQVGRRNFEEITGSDMVVAVLDGDPPDIGTAAEVAWAAAQHKPVVGYRSDFRATGEEEVETNLMIPAAIEISGGSIVATIEELEVCVSMMGADLAKRSHTTRRP